MNHFICIKCGRQISGDALGTQNRNHCPHCLYSVHLDLKKPGDRQSDCHGLMRPLGLAYKNEGHQKQGELCLVHRCQSCAAISKNRLAGDDNPDQVLKIYHQSLKQSFPDIVLLAKTDEREIITQLYGKPNLEKYLLNKPT